MFLIFFAVHSYVTRFSTSRTRLLTEEGGYSLLPVPPHSFHQAGSGRCRPVAELTVQRTASRDRNKSYGSSSSEIIDTLKFRGLLELTRFLNNIRLWNMDAF